MRPLRLVIEGFRSHHGRTEIDWSGRRLVGIVGPIGSGKSSILDAIAFALFGKTPAFEKDRKALINQRRDVCRVELAFEVDDRAYRVVRIVRRKGAAQHSLLEHPGGDLAAKAVELASGDTQVGERIVQLLGLDFPTFCRSVLLAQNRFAEFLSSAAGELDKVLKRVFGFERIDAMREEAKSMLAGVERQLPDLEARHRQIEEQRESLAQLGRELELATRRAVELEELAPRITETQKEKETHARALQAAEEQRETLQRIADGLPDEELAAANMARAAAEQASQVAARALQDAAAELARAEAARSSIERGAGRPEALARADGLIAKLEEKTRVAADNVAKSARLRVKLDEAAAEMKRHRRVLADAEKERDLSAHACGEAGARLAAAREAHATVESQVGDRQALDDQREDVLALKHARETFALEHKQAEVLAAKVSSTAAELETARASLERARTADTRAGEALTSARHVRASSEEALRAAERGEMAFALRGHLEVGEPCPVCEQLVAALPTGAASADLERAGAHLAEARRAETAAERSARTAHTELTTCEQQVKSLEDRVADLAREAEQARDTAKRTEQRLKAREAVLRGRLGEGDLLSILDSRKSALEKAAAEVLEASAALHSAESAEKDRRHRVATAKLTLENSARELADLERRHKDLEGEHADAAAARDQLQAALQELLGPGDPVELLTGMRQRLAQATAAVSDALARKDHATHAVEQARLAAAKGQKQERSLVARLSSLLGRIGHQPEDVHDLSALTVAIKRQLAEGFERQAEARQSAEEKLIEANRTAAELLAKAGLFAGEDFAEAVANARAKRGSLHAQVGKLEEQIQGQGALTQKIEALRAQAQVYRQLEKDLTANHFINFLLAEERTRLTELGSQRFEFLTGGRYRFADDATFDVLDLANAEAKRDAKTLSGGETFLASLALALALAERVTLSGGRLDAFFLDEGFGSLDPPHLDLAMDGIERLVTDSKTRLVVLVSHVEAMRERIDDLIVLDKDPLTGDTAVRRE